MSGFDEWESTFSVSRMEANDTGRTDSLVVISTGNGGVLRPVSNKAQLLDLSRFGKEYVLYCVSDVDIKANDQVTIGTTNYGVAGVSDYEDLADNDNHLRVVIYKQ